MRIPEMARLGASRALQSADAPRRKPIATPELAERLGLTGRSVRRLVAEDRVPFLKIGKFSRRLVSVRPVPGRR